MFWALGASTTDGKVRLHLVADMTFLDAKSWMLVFRAVAWEYDKPHELLAADAEPLMASDFLDFCQKQSTLKTTTIDDVWNTERLKTLPLGPKLPWSNGQGQAMAFGRHSSHLDANTWGRLKAEAAFGKVTPTSLLLTYFQDAVDFSSTDGNFSLTATVTRRPPDLTESLGEFTNVAILSCTEEDFNKDRLARATDIKEQICEQVQLDRQAGMQIMKQWRQIRQEEALLFVK